MRMFLKGMSLIIVNSDSLLKETEEVKRAMRHAVADGLATGVVRPFRGCALTMSSGNHNVFDLMR